MCVCLKQIHCAKAGVPKVWRLNMLSSADAKNPGSRQLQNGLSLKTDAEANRRFVGRPQAFFVVEDKASLNTTKQVEHGQLRA